ncbi:ABC transporter permease [soil metagenome]
MLIPRLAVLWTDVVIWLAVIALVIGCVQARRNPRLRATWRRVLGDAPSLCSAVVLGFFLLITVADSVHFQRALAAAAQSREAGSGAAASAADAGSAERASTVYDSRTESLLDVALSSLVRSREGSYSAPLAWHSFAKESVLVDGQPTRAVSRLNFGGAHLKDPKTEWASDVTWRAAMGAFAGLCVAALGWFAAAALLARRSATHTDASSAPTTWRQAILDIAANRTDLPLRAGLLTFAAIALLAGPTIALMSHYHVLGTDRTGNDVLYQALKSVRTAFVIGTLATLATLPFAVAFGVLAGYLRGWVDEVIQYAYTTLSSVPNVLLIAACVLMMQTLLDQNPEWFDTSAQRSDIRLFLLCVILGVTGWAGLCRLLRAETLKLRELEYVQAAQAFGVGPARIMSRHIFPNVLHLVLISTVLDFSALILYEAVLSYVGVGVDPAMNSFGGMINLARSEMSRDPVVWWSFASAFGFMVTLVLAANLFADGVREAFDPRGQLFKPKRIAKRKPAVAAPDIKSPDDPVGGRA